MVRMLVCQAKDMSSILILLDYYILNIQNNFCPFGVKW